jgi:hypothetical protein
MAWELTWPIVWASYLPSSEVTLSPSSMQRGTAGDIGITGTGLDDVTAIRFNVAGGSHAAAPTIVVSNFTIDSPTHITAEVIVASAAPIAFYELQLTAADIVYDDGTHFQVIASTAAAVKDPGVHSSIWVCETDASGLMTSSLGMRAPFIAACQNLGINRVILDGVMLSPSWDPVQGLAAIQAFNAAGIQVWGGRRLADHTYQALFDAVLAWNKANPTAKFTALAYNLDFTGTDAATKTFLEEQYASLVTARSRVVGGTETLNSQSLPLVLVGVSQSWSGAVMARAFAQVVSQADVVQMKHFDYGTGGSHVISYSVGLNAGVQTICDAMAKYFTVSMSCEELSLATEGTAPYSSRFDLGKAVYQTDQILYSTYFVTTVPHALFRGFDTYLDVDFMLWYLIQGSPTYPSGIKAPQDSVAVGFTTRRQQRRYTHKVIAAKVSFRDSVQTVTENSALYDLQEGITNVRSLGVTIPSGAVNGAADFRLQLYLVGYQNAAYYDQLYYDDANGYEATLLAMSMPQLAAAATNPKGTAWEWRRADPVLLWDSGWQIGVVVVEGFVPAPAPTLASILPVSSERSDTVPVEVVITGQYLTGATVVSFGAGITVGSFTVDSDTQITAQLMVTLAGALGYRTLTVTTPTGTATLVNAFLVIASIEAPVTSYDTINTLKGLLNNHFTLSISTGAVHRKADTANAITATDAVDLATSLTLVTEMKDGLNAHCVEPGVHFVDDMVNRVTLAATDATTAAYTTNELIAAFKAHLVQETDGRWLYIKDLVDAAMMD